MTGMKMTDMQMMDQNDVKLQNKKYSVNRHYIAMKCAVFCCYFLNTQHCNTLRVWYLFLTENVNEMLHKLHNISIVYRRCYTIKNE